MHRRGGGWVELVRSGGARSSLAESSNRRPRRSVTGSCREGLVRLTPEQISWAAHELKRRTARVSLDPASRLTAAPLFPNPRTGRIWLHKALARVWPGTRARWAPEHRSLRGREALDGDRRDPPRRTRAAPPALPWARFDRVNPSACASRRQRTARSAAFVERARERQALARQRSTNPRTSTWALLDSNQGPTGYEPAALTAELRARGAEATTAAPGVSEGGGPSPSSLKAPAGSAARRWRGSRR